jgi:hypothetical protein
MLAIVAAQYIEPQEQQHAYIALCMSSSWKPQNSVAQCSSWVTAYVAEHDQSPHQSKISSYREQVQVACRHTRTVWHLALEHNYLKRSQRKCRTTVSCITPNCTENCGIMASYKSGIACCDHTVGRVDCQSRAGPCQRRGSSNFWIP